MLKSKLFIVILFTLVAIWCDGPVTVAAEVRRLSLAEAIQLSRQDNAEIAALRHEAEAARIVRTGQTSRFLPVIDGVVTAGTRRDQDPSSDNLSPAETRDYNQYSGGLTLRQNLFRGFADYASYQAESANVEASDLELLKKIQDQRLAVIGSYFEIQLVLAKIAAAEEVAKARDQQLSYAKNRFRAGTVTELDVLRSQFEVESQKPILASLRSDLDKKKLSFAHLIGLPLDKPFELAVSLEQGHAVATAAQLPSLSVALTQAIEGNTRIRVLQTERKQIDYANATRRGAHWPKVDFVLKAETRANVREEIGTADSQRLSGMVEMTVPLFSGLVSLHDRAEAAETAAAIAARFEAAKQTLLTDLNGALRDVELSRVRAEVGQANVDLARRTVDQSMSQYKAGTATLTMVLDTYTQLLQARNEYAQALFDGIKAVAVAQNLMGVRVDDATEKKQG